VILARAFVAADDIKYANKIAELLRSWIDANPFGYGMNWKSPLELGVRLINWVWAIDLVRGAGVFDDVLWKAILQNVHWAIWDCQRKFSRGSSANNHLIGEAAGVYIASCYFNKLPHAESWRLSSKEVLEREIVAQTYSDGCTKEHAFGYQFFVLQFFLLSLRAGSSINDHFTESYKSRLLEMYRFMNEISRDNGQPPNMGDRDDGYVLNLGELPRHAAELISVGSLEFSEPELLLSDSSETVFWLYGETGQVTAESSTRRQSKVFPESGYAILRSRRFSAFFDFAELGYGPIAAHGHADCLSICLSVDGQPVFHDPGTYDYFSYPEWRQYFRTTEAHNTAEIDGHSQSESLGPFLWGRRAAPSLDDWRIRDGQTEVVASHDGYLSRPCRVIHQRKISLKEHEDLLVIVDRFSGSGSYDVAIRFHCAPDCKIEEDDGNWKIVNGRRGFAVSFVVRALECDNLRPRVERSWASDSYHSKQANSAIVIEGRLDGDASVSTKFRIY
jgi:hypothetical protein